MRAAFEKSGMQGVRRWRIETGLESQEDRRIIHKAAFHAVLGELDEAFEWLEKAWSLPLWGNEYAPSCFYWDPLRSDRRFEELLRKLNLPEEAIQRHLELPGS